MSTMTETAFGGEGGRQACPRCHALDTLIPLGEREDRSSRWLPWATTHTLLCLCGACDEIVAMEMTADGTAVAA